MIKIDDKLVIQDLLDTASTFKPNRKDFIRKEYNSFYILNQALTLNNRKIIRGVTELFKNNPSLADVVEKYSYDSYWDFIDRVDSEQDLIKDIATHYCRFLKRIRFDPIDFLDNIKSYSEKDFKDIILSYFATFGDKYYNLVKKYFDENRVNIGSRVLDDAAGFFAPLIWLNSGYIYSVYPTYDTMSAASMVHEFGHAIDAELYLFPQQKKAPLFSDILLEVPSTSFEMGFYDYLRNQKIDEDGGLILSNNRISDLLDYCRNLKKSLNAENLDINEFGAAVDEDGNMYHFRGDLVYGLGYYNALHLNEIRKDSSTEYTKVLNNVITTRKEASLDDTIEMMGFNREDYITGKYIKPKVKEDYLTLKKRYKID